MKAGMEFARVKDFQKEMESKRERAQIEQDFKDDMRERAALPWGSEGSLYNADGTVNKEMVNGLVTQYQERNLGTKKRYWLRQNNLQSEEELKGANLQLKLDAFDLVGRQERQNIEQSFNDTYTMYAEQGNAAGAFSAVDSAVARGIITPQRGEYMKARVIKRSTMEKAASGGGYSSEGTTYMGEDAVLAATAARTNWKPGGAAASAPAPAGAPAGDSANLELPGQGDSFGGKATGLFPEDEAATPADGTSSGSAHTLTTEMLTPGTGASGLGIEVAHAPSASDLWAAGDDSGVARVMTASEFDSYRQSFVPPCAVSTAEKPDGTMEFACPSYAADSVKYMVGEANRDGEISEDAAYTVIAEVTLDAITYNSDATVADIMSNFEGSGIFEALGKGNANVGKQKVEGIVTQFRDRGLQVTGRLTMPHIKQMVEAHVGRGDMFINSEWRRMEKLNPGLDEGANYRWPGSNATEAKRQKWRDLKALYVKYRDEYNPLHPQGDVTDGEFAEKAQGFYNWYMGGSGKYRDGKSASQKLASQWYLAQCGLALGKATVGYNSETKGLMMQNDKGESYADSVDVVREVLRMPLPQRLTADTFAELHTKQQTRNAELQGHFKSNSEDSYAQLNTWGEQHGKKAEAKRKAEEKRAKEEADAADKAAKAAEKEAARRQRIEQYKVRSKVRNMSWAWDGVQRGDGSAPRCTIPQAEWDEAMEKMGHEDGVTTLYVSIGGKRIEVEGPNKEGRILLNTRAVFAVQPKPKKGQNPRLDGTLEYTYSLNQN